MYGMWSKMIEKCPYKIMEWHRTSRIVNVPKCRFYGSFVKKCVGESSCKILKKIEKTIEKQK